MTHVDEGEGHGVPKQILREWVIEALNRHGGRATLVEVCRHIWLHHEDELWDSGDLFYTWQYDVRWAASDLRGRGILRQHDESPRGVWGDRTARPIADIGEHTWP